MGFRVCTATCSACLLGTVIPGPIDGTFRLVQISFIIVDGVSLLYKYNTAAITDNGQLIVYKNPTSLSNFE